MSLTSKERVRKALLHEPVDRVPANFECTATVRGKLLAHYGYKEMEDLYQHFDIDIRPADAHKPWLNFSVFNMVEVFFGRFHPSVPLYPEYLITFGLYPLLNIYNVTAFG